LEKIRILLVEDDPVWQHALAAYLGKQPDFCLVHAAATKEEALSIFQQTEVDVVLMDIVLTPGKYDGLDAALDMLRQKPAVKMMMLTSVEESEVILDAFTAGAVNYIPKTKYEKLPEAIRQAHQNVTVIPEEVAGVILGELHRLRQSELQQRITSMEKEILQLLAQGYTRSGIAEYLQISTNTVRTHIRHIMKKLGATSGQEAAQIAKRKGLI